MFAFRNDVVKQVIIYHKIIAKTGMMQFKSSHFTVKEVGWIMLKIIV